MPLTLTSGRWRRCAAMAWYGHIYAPDSDGRRSLRKDGHALLDMHVCPAELRQVAQAGACSAALSDRITELTEAFGPALNPEEHANEAVV